MPPSRSIRRTSSVKEPGTSQNRAGGGSCRGRSLDEAEGEPFRCRRAAADDGVGASVVVLCFGVCGYAWRR